MRKRRNTLGLWESEELSFHSESLALSCLHLPLSNTIPREQRLEVSSDVHVDLGVRPPAMRCCGALPGEVSGISGAGHSAAVTSARFSRVSQEGIPDS